MQFRKNNELKPIFVKQCFLFKLKIKIALWDNYITRYNHPLTYQVELESFQEALRVATVPYATQDFSS